MTAKRLCIADLAKRFKVTRQAIAEQLERPDAPQPDAEGRYSLAAVAAFRRGRPGRIVGGVNPYLELAIQRARLTKAQASREEFEDRREREKWQTKEEAEATAQQVAETIQSDLFGTLPLELAGKLSGRVFTPYEVRAVVRSAVDGMVRAWIRGGGIPPDAVPNDAPNKAETKGHRRT